MGCALSSSKKTWGATLRLFCRGSNFSNNKAQALLETLLIIPVFMVLLVGLFWFSRVLLTKQQLIIAARYGTDLIASTTLSEQQIKNEIRNYLSDKNIEGRKLDPNKLGDENIVVKINNFALPEFDGFEDIINPVKMGQLLNSYTRLIKMPASYSSELSSVEIFYEFSVPKIFSPGIGFAKTITLTGRSEVLAGTGCASNNHKRNLNSSETN